MSFPFKNLALHSYWWWF